MARRSKPTYQVTARNEKAYWAVTIDGHEDWGEATAWNTRQIEPRAVGLIAKHTGTPADQIVVTVRRKLGRSR